MKWKFRNMMETTEPVFAGKMFSFCVESLGKLTERSVRCVNGVGVFIGPNPTGPLDQCG